MGQGGRHIIGPCGVFNLHTVKHVGGGRRDERRRQDRVQRDQVQRQTHLRRGFVGVCLEGRPRGLCLQVFVTRSPDRPQFGGGFADFHRLHRGLIAGYPFSQIRDQRVFFGPVFARRWHVFAEFRAAEFGDAADKVAQDIRQILVHGGLEILPRELRIRGFGRMGQQPPAPVVRRQDFQRLIHEHPTPARGRELAAVIVQIVERFDVVDQLPRLLRTHDRCREAERVERDVVLAHELGIAHVVGTFVGAPPAFPIRPFARIDPFLRAGDVFDGGIEPDIKDLALHPRPICVAAFDRHTPVQIARDTTVLQPVTVMQPFLCNRGGQHGPVGLAVDPFVQLVLHLRLTQEQMLGRAHLEVGSTGNGRSRVDQIFGV